jgi:choline dehydrogenase-like flavoprotein
MYYDDADVRSIVTTHEIIKDRLERAGVGTLEYLSDDPDRHVREQIAWGSHHIGTTRMASTPTEGVVDPNCRVFGLDNLFVAAPSVFPTSSQANPVLTLTAMTLRLTDYLRSTFSDTK